MITSGSRARSRSFRGQHRNHGLAGELEGMLINGSLFNEASESSEEDDTSNESSEEEDISNESSENEDEEELEPADTNAIDRLPVRMFVSDEVARFPQEHKSCTICMEDFRGRDTVRTLPCLHFFHKTCIDAWLCRQGTCPICKGRVDAPEASPLQSRLSRQQHAVNGLQRRANMPVQSQPRQSARGGVLRRPAAAIQRRSQRTRGGSQQRP